MSAKISKEIAAIQRGLGEKVGNIIMSLSMLILGFVIAFIWGWKLSLIMLGIVPLLGVTGAGMAMSLDDSLTSQMRAYA
jgi:ABC-type multidrug transport system fused ATPase/permease subunit